MPTLTGQMLQDHLDRNIEEGICFVQTAPKIKFFSRLSVSDFFEEANEIDFHFTINYLMTFRKLAELAKIIFTSFIQKFNLSPCLSKNVAKKLLAYLSVIQNQVDKIS